MESDKEINIRTTRIFTEDILMNRLKPGIPEKLRDSVHLIAEICDEDVKILGMLRKAEYKREYVREVDEKIE